MNGLLSGDKVRPVLINSKLPLDVLGKVISWRDLTDNCTVILLVCRLFNIFVLQIWDLSDFDKDGHLDKEEFTVVSSCYFGPKFELLN